MNDFKFSFRQLVKNPGFTAVAVLTLALGIGANTAIFQLLDAIRLRSLPARKPQELALVQISDMTGARGNFNSPYPAVTNPLWERIRDTQQAFSGMLAWSADSFNLATSGDPRFARSLWVSGDFFRVLGIQPVLGRVFTAADDRRGNGFAGAVISFPFWQREFGGDSSVIGRKLTLDGHPVEIIGVTPASFFGLEIGRSFDVAVPISSEAILFGANNRLEAGTTWWLTLMGRLKPEWPIERATAHLSSISPGIFEATLPANYPSANVTNYLGFKLAAVPAGTGVSSLRQTYSRPLWLLLAIAGLVLLIACANLANLLLARASTRQREIAVRLALGASRGRLIRQLMSESLLLAVVGAILGWLPARMLSRFLVAFLSTEGNALFVDLHLGWRVFAFTTGLAGLTCILFGLMPALRGARTSPGEALKAGSRGMTASRERFGLRRALVVSQVALSLLLVVSALLFSLSLRNLMTLDAGFLQEGVLIAAVNLYRLDLPLERRQPIKRELLERLRAIPGVDAVADAAQLPLSGNSWDNKVWIDGSAAGEGKESYFSRIGASYFKTMRTPLLSGREFDDHDSPASPKVAIVNETFVRRFVNGTNPIGRRVWRETTPTDPETGFEIVGVVKDTKYHDLREDFVPIVFLAASQDPAPAPYDLILVRSKGPVAELTSAVKRSLGEVNPQISVQFEVFKTAIQNGLLRERLMATLASFFGFLALLLACVGLYGILAYGVASRTNEIGLRMALGAQRRDVLWLILREAFLLVLIGVAVGLPAVLAATRLVSSLLYGLTPADPTSIGAAAGLMFAVAAGAGYFPARRATKVDPMEALRCE
jgi:putative ABC transport system permease protein